MSEAIMVRKSAMSRLWWERRTTMLANFPPSPVRIIMPTTIPAEAQDVATDRDVFEVDSNALRRPDRFIRVSFLKKLATKIRRRLSPRTWRGVSNDEEVIRTPIGPMY
jgi:FAD/FMN-containing dehydrogenase